ncbi:sugar ABC transporter permease [Leifsonia xyli subsp. xyli]|uniref:ABC transporter, permease protein n=2 Tax=Leifsonia xyli subsp. xyli TaxID=59736 RepID=Q6AH43_LEIXX|nr:sugar ABC transporter permease [Leifsonia xyli]AAT88302.1 ABC transporter, permease protein [Leifsonia xyli subsp. xyli str. CTCB07]ODA89739.1 sugar ABC transporter permease [Leifsonia xyli subsp. xyli]
MSVAPGPKRSRSFLSVSRPWLLLAPALAVLAVLLLWPLARVVLISLQDYGLREIVSGKTNFVGFANYAEVFGNATLWTVALPNTVVLAILSVVGTVALGTLVAVLMANLGPVWRTVVGSAIMVAWAMPAVTGIYVWIWIFDAENGIVNQTLKNLGLMDESFNWFTNPISFYAIVLLNIVHHGFPFVAIIVLAGLLGVPKETLEAAEMDGAGLVRRFFSIVVPSLKQVFAVVIILSTIWDFKVFAQVYLMPGGSGSNRPVLNLGVWSYVESFGQNRYGFGSAIAVLLTLVLLAITVIYVRTMLKEEKL